MINTTLKKLSEISGLSVSTVSRALNNHPDISNKTKLLVTELADTLDYEPNINAVHLRTKNTRLFGAIIPTVTNLFYDSVIHALEQDSRQYDYSLLVLQSNDNPDIENTCLKLCRQNRVNGVFISTASGRTNTAAFQKLKESDTPIVFMDRVPEENIYTSVCFADETSALLASNAIIENEKQNILAIFGDQQLLITRKRLNAFSNVMQKHNKRYHCYYSTSETEAEAITNQHLDEKPDVIFCMTDEILIGVMRAVQKRGLKIPEDIGIITISNGLVPTLYYPAITYIETSGAQLGKEAFQSMMNTLSGGRVMQQRMIEPKLVAGGSL